MCGRYYIDGGMAEEVEELLEEISRDWNGGAGGRGYGGQGSYGGRERTGPSPAALATGDICPSSHAMVLIKTPAGIVTGIKCWGFWRWDGKGLVINARAETAADKRMFKESVRCRRCVVPASGFYEWNREKERFTFSLPGKRTMFFAGIYRRFQEEEDRYVILTTKANASMEPVHPRMPLILGREEAKLWLGDDGAVGRLLAAEPGELVREAEYEQMRLPFP